MKVSEGQKKVFDFLLKKFQLQEEFSKEQFMIASGWGESTFNTYWSKQFIPLLNKTKNNKYRVTEVFRRFITWEKFQEHVTQNRHVAADYNTLSYNNVIIFEFYMPLTNEGYLRTALDSLFYKDSIIARLNTIDKSKLNLHFPKIENEDNETYYDRICDWISKKFSGYSITHVSGRFRVGELKNLDDANEILKLGNKYLIDETTAVVKFIFPCGEVKPNQFLETEDYFEDLLTEMNKDIAEGDRIRWFFYILFVKSIVEIINGEDEIWLLESGMKNKLHIWRVQ